METSLSGFAFCGGLVILYAIMGLGLWPLFDDFVDEDVPPWIAVPFWPLALIVMGTMLLVAMVAAFFSGAWRDW